MAIQTVMDRNGDTRHQFDCDDPPAVALAENRYRKLTCLGFRAVALAKDGEPGRLLERFDPEVEHTLFIPRLQGG